MLRIRNRSFPTRELQGEQFFRENERFCKKVKRREIFFSWMNENYNPILQISVLYYRSDTV